MAFFNSALPLDQNRNLILALRPSDEPAGGITTVPVINPGTISIFLLNNVRAVSILCRSGAGRYQLHNQVVVVIPEHYIKENERLTFAVDKNDSQITFKAVSVAVIFELTQLT